VKEYSNKEIREIRMKAGMTQSVFALYMGVSKKTVEAWEGGRSHPNGSAFRLLEVLSTSDPNVTDYVVVDE
jgi:putative transcriptional regulator